MENVQEALKRILNMFLGKNVHFGLAVKPLKPSFFLWRESDSLTEVDCIRFFFGGKRVTERHYFSRSRLDIALDRLVSKPLRRIDRRNRHPTGGPESLLQFHLGPIRP